MDRKEFLKQLLCGVGLTGAGLLHGGCGKASANVSSHVPEKESLDEDSRPLDWRVALGETGLTVPILAMGTGTIGWNGASNQTRLGMERFVAIAHRAYERGVRFYDMAEAYGSQPFVAEAIKDFPRENLTLLTKMASTDSLSESETRRKVDAFCQEVGTDYFDILLMHCMTSGDWPNTNKGAMAGLARAKEEGRVKAVGISCHSLDAIRVAAESPWVDVILARLNPFETRMDGTTEAVNEALGVARRNGKGVMGMKIFGEGSRVKDEERERSLRYALTESNLHCMTIGFETVAQLDDAVDRIIRIQSE